LTSAAAAGGGGPGATTLYDYDPAGNRTTRTRAGVPTGYSYDRADRLLATRLNGTPLHTYTVINAGDLTRRVGGTVDDRFGYDQARRLTSSSVADFPAPGRTTTATYACDGDIEWDKRATSDVRGPKSKGTRGVRRPVGALGERRPSSPESTGQGKGNLGVVLG
jgi:YD repeat-containing protein